MPRQPICGPCADGICDSLGCSLPMWCICPGHDDGTGCGDDACTDDHRDEA